MILFNLMPFYSLIKSNEFIIFLILVFFILIVIIILRKMNVSSTIRLEREEMGAQSMLKLRNPFMFKINDESLNCNNYRNGLKVSLKCDNSFWVFTFWGVNIEDFHYSLDEEWQPMRTALLDNKFMENHYLFRSEPELYYETNENVNHLVKPVNEFHSGESLGYNPRSRYPLIVRNDDDDGIELNDNDVVCLISIIHLKDSICSMTTSLITQYLKQRSGHMFNLHQIFAPEDESEERSPMCVICQTSSVSHTLLPCRHACLCQQCFARVDKCPLCRSSITSFFKISEEDQLSDEDTNFESTFNSSRGSNGWFSSLNSKLNQWFGFH